MSPYGRLRHPQQDGRLFDSETRSSLHLVTLHLITPSSESPLLAAPFLGLPETPLPSERSLTQSPTGTLAVHVRSLCIISCGSATFRSQKGWGIMGDNTQPGRQIGLIRYLTRQEFADYLGVSRQYVDRMERAGKLPKPDATAGGRPLWREATVAKYAEQRRR